MDNYDISKEVDHSKEEFFTCLDHELEASFAEAQARSKPIIQHHKITRACRQPTHTAAKNKTVESSAVTNAKMIDIDGKVTRIPLMSLALFENIAKVVEEISSTDISDVVISLPGSRTAVGCLKDLLLSGQTKALSRVEVRSVQDFLRDIGMTCITMEEYLEDDIDCCEVVESYDSDDSVVKEESVVSEDEVEGTIHEFWEPSQVITSVSVCSKSCKNDCHVVVEAWETENQEGMKALFTGETKLATRNKLISHLVAQGNLGIETDCYVVKSHKFCIPFLHHATGISEYILISVMKDYWRGIRHYEHGNHKVFRQPSVATIKCIGWFKQFLLLYGQSSPDEQLTVLPYWLKGKVLYKIYVKEVPKPRVALRTFYKHLDTYFGPQRINQDFPRVRISQYSSHSVCDTCVALNTKRKECRSEAEMSMVKGLISQHQLEFSSARHAIEKIKNDSLQFPHDHLFIQLDGMFVKIIKVFCCLINFHRDGQPEELLPPVFRQFQGVGWH